MQVVSQKELRIRVLPLLRTRGERYRKFSKIRARPARPGEHVVTRTSDGMETENVAEAGDFIVENQTKALERYVVSSEKFAKRYEKLKELNDDWALFQAIGEVVGLKLTSALARELDFQSVFEIEAPWGGTEVIRQGNYLVCPPDESEIYGIAEEEFNETYAPVREGHV